MELEFSRQIFGGKNIVISNFVKIRPVGTEFFFPCVRTDMTKLIVGFRKFANAPKTVIGGI